MYPNDRDCIWTIYADYGKRITFHFATVNIEHHPNCSYDFLKVNIIYAILVAVIRVIETSYFTANELIILIRLQVIHTRFMLDQNKLNYDEKNSYFQFS